MTTISFTRYMKLNKKESEKLLDIIESNCEVKVKVTTPPVKEASKQTLDKVFGDT
ncbi:hypothetical protein B0O40_0621 [Ruminococcaceae bacterium R-25]|nr:hypothetical protein B0O40_0621 [Ruminococcaceae bacterium R-25]SUQ11251.1 hypothetical protein SAMN06297423_0621 [Oscillospiraceae bacterium]